MPEASIRTAPEWFMTVAAVLLSGNLIGIMACIRQVTLAALPVTVIAICLVTLAAKPRVNRWTSSAGAFPDGE